MLIRTALMEQTHTHTNAYIHYKYTVYPCKNAITDNNYPGSYVYTYLQVVCECLTEIHCHDPIHGHPVLEFFISGLTKQLLSRSEGW